MPKERFIVISGATGYLGSNLAEHYANNGENLFLIARDRKKLQVLKNSLLQSHNVLIETKAIDFAKPSAYSKLNKIRRDLNVFAAIHTVGAQSPIGSLINQSPKLVRKSMEINFISAFLLTKFCVSRMDKKERSSLVFFSGGGATFPRPGFGPYGSAKTALIRMIETLSFELNLYNISANVISPGALPSQMMLEIISNQETVSDTELQAATETLHEGDLALQKVINLTEFLLGDEGIQISGKLISAKWDDWENWTNHMGELRNSDIYTLRRITGKDRGLNWGDL
jgi:3-oxoacyl-[acyl-carrier protein] reductase